MSDENELKNIAKLTAGDDPAVPAWLIPDKLYDILKWLTALVFPALEEA